MTFWQRARRILTVAFSSLAATALVLQQAYRSSPASCREAFDSFGQAFVSAGASAVLHLFVSLDWTPIRYGRVPGDCSEVTFRVTKGIGSRGYGALRITAVCEIDQKSPAEEHALQRCPHPVDDPLARRFEQCGRFRDRWQQFHASTAIVDLRRPGGVHHLSFAHLTGHLKLDISLPPRKAGAHGIIIGDPCISSRYIPGLCDTGYNVIERLPRLLNLVNEVDRLDFIILLGDNFYDVHGALTAEFWSRLSRRTQQTLLLSVPGNHDFWMFAPQVRLLQDQLGKGFAQWYAQDTASRLGKASEKNNASEFPDAEEFFFYHIVGNIGFLGFSSAHTFDSQEHRFQEACEYLVENSPDHIYVLGHWHKEDLGCAPGMDVPTLFERLRDEYCMPVADRMRYFMGHDHCSFAQPDGVGYLIGAGGAAQRDCGMWGVAYLDTRPMNLKPRGVPGASGLLKPTSYLRRRFERVTKRPGHLLAKLTLAAVNADYFPLWERCIQARMSLRNCLNEHADEVWINGTGSRWGSNLKSSLKKGLASGLTSLTR